MSYNGVDYRREVKVLRELGISTDRFGRYCQYIGMSFEEMERFASSIPELSIEDRKSRARETYDSLSIEGKDLLDEVIFKKPDDRTREF